VSDLGTDEDFARSAERLLDTLRAYGDSYMGFAREFAASEGLNSTDAMALIEIVMAEHQGSPLSPARLRKHIGLTSGATSTLINRLEESGYVVRSRVDADRRVVTLRAAAGVEAIAEAFLAPLKEQVVLVMRRYPTEVLAQCERLVSDLRGSVESFTEDASAARGGRL
jgi:DNA-binding MarR family transcriptional regulator